MVAPNVSARPTSKMASGVAQRMNSNDSAMAFSGGERWSRTRAKRYVTAIAVARITDGARPTSTA